MFEGGLTMPYVIHSTSISADARVYVYTYMCVYVQSQSAWMD